MTILIVLVVLIAAYILLDQRQRMRPVSAETVKQTLASYGVPEEQIESLAANVLNARDFNRLVRRIETEVLEVRISALGFALSKCSGDRSTAHKVALAVCQLAVNGKTVHPALQEFAVGNVVNERLLLGLIMRKVNQTSTFDQGHRFLLSANEHSLECRNEKRFVDWSHEDSAYLASESLPGDMLEQAALTFANPPRWLRKIDGVFISEQPLAWAKLAQNAKEAEEKEKASSLA